MTEKNVRDASPTQDWNSIPRKARRIAREAVSAAFSESLLKAIKERPEVGAAALGAVFQERGPDLLAEVRRSKGLSDEIRQMAGAAGIMSVSISGHASVQPITKHGFIDAELVAMSVGMSLNDAPIENSENDLTVVAYDEAVCRLIERLKAIDDKKLRAELFEAVGEIAMLAAAIGTFDTVSASARKAGSEQSKPARSGNSEKKVRRLGQIKAAIFTLFETYPNWPAGKIALSLPDDLRGLYGDLGLRTLRRDIKDLRKEWSDRR